MREGISRVLRAAAVGSDDADILKAERWCSRMSQHKDTPKECRSVYFNVADCFVVAYESALVASLPFVHTFYRVLFYLHLSFRMRLSCSPGMNLQNWHSAAHALHTSHVQSCRGQVHGAFASAAGQMQEHRGL